MDEAITHSAAQLGLALRTKRELDKYGEIREVTLETQGKVDRPGAETVEVQVRLPRGNVPPEPRLDPRPPPGGRTAGRPGVADLKTKTRPLEPVRPPSPAPVEPDCARRLAACQETSAAHAERLAHCEQKLDALSPDVEVTRALAGCRGRLAGAKSCVVTGFMLPPEPGRRPRRETGIRPVLVCRASPSSSWLSRP